MRQDIAKVICEGYRDMNPFGKPRNRNPKTFAPIRRHKLVEDDEGELDMPTAPLRESCSMFAKDFTDRLGAIRGWVRQQAGRPYNRAKSELSKLLGGNGVLQRHVLGHVDEFLVPPHRVRIVEGKAFYKEDRGRSQIENNVLYADPIDGIIKWGKGPSWRGSRALRGSKPKNLQRLDHRKATRIDLGSGQTLTWDAGERSWMLERVWEALHGETCFRRQRAGVKILRDRGFRAA